MREFLRNYNGNRCPLGMYFHAALLLGTPEHVDQLNTFFDWALAQPDVWVVTVSQVEAMGGGACSGPCTGPHVGLPAASQQHSQGGGRRVWGPSVQWPCCGVSAVWPLPTCP